MQPITLQTVINAIRLLETRYPHAQLTQEQFLQIENILSKACTTTKPPSPPKAAQ